MSSYGWNNTKALCNWCIVYWLPSYCSNWCMRNSIPVIWPCLSQCFVILSFIQLDLFSSCTHSCVPIRDLKSMSSTLFRFIVYITPLLVIPSNFFNYFSSHWRSMAEHYLLHYIICSNIRLVSVSFYFI